jgi:hypothetical protein
MLAACVAYSSAMKVEAVCTSQTLINTVQPVINCMCEVNRTIVEKLTSGTFYMLIRWCITSTCFLNGNVQYPMACSYWQFVRSVFELLNFEAQCLTFQP